MTTFEGGLALIMFCIVVDFCFIMLTRWNGLMWHSSSAWY